MTPTQNTWILEVCTCCMVVQANGECGDYCHDVEPLSKIEPGNHVTAGMVAEEHADTCDETTRENGDCECEQLGFRTRPCDGCGDPMAGLRFALTLWSA